MSHDFKQLFGFMMFWFAAGMLFMIFVPNHFIGILMAGALMMVGYHLFSR
ncbi:MAG: hypothetical protein LIO75_06005 [Lachnospiraceae bacterium]|nr:hypothetical protein [Lachnospiraceae bacterium]